MPAQARALDPCGKFRHAAQRRKLAQLLCVHALASGQQRVHVGVQTLDLIAATTTTTGLKVYARLDTATYATKIKVTDEQMSTVRLAVEDFHPEWNYRILPTLISD